MKKMYLFLSAALLMNCALFAQEQPFNDFINKYKKESGFTYAFLSKDLFESTMKTDIKDSDWKQVQKIVKNLGSLSMLAAEKTDQSKQLFREALELAPNEDFDELLTVRDGKDNIKILAKSEESTVTDLVVIVASEAEFVLICFSGVVELNNFAELVRLINANEVTALARSAEKITAQFQISPNPSTGIIQLNFEEPDDYPTLLSVTDLSGKVVKSLNLTQQTNQTVNLSELSAGSYWVQIKTEKGKIGVKQVQMVQR
jgi:hypothetical protein